MSYELVYMTERTHNGISLTKNLFYRSEIYEMTILETKTEPTVKLHIQCKNDY